MDSKYADALHYLSTPVGSFWKWDDQGSVIVWSNGSTLAFREELALVLGCLSPQGLPPLDAVLLLIGATRAYWAEDSVPLQHRLREKKLDKDLDTTRGGFESGLFACLDVIHQLSMELNQSPDSKAELAMLAFESAPRSLSLDVANVVCEILFKRLNGALPNLSRLRGGRVQTTRSLVHDLWPLRNGLKGVTKESFLLRHQTGLDSEPETAEIDYCIDQTAMRSLLDKLSNDPELAGLSRLARNLAAVVQLPRAVSDSDELPYGGISDLSNRGSLDRLLLSELAHDDLMLATRVALNEALYLRREIPPSFPPERRHVLIDAGLRMWGVPRVYSTAVALSLAANGGLQTTLSAYRASGADIVPINITSPDGLISHLAALETEVHPGRALAEFCQHVAEGDLPGDIVLVTTDAVLDDPDFQRELSEANVPMLYVATVNRNGDFQLWSRSVRGRKRHATLRLDLDQILKTPNQMSSKLIDTSMDPDLPAIFRVRPFPIRLPIQIGQKLDKNINWSVPLPRDINPFSSGQNGGMASNVITVSASSPTSTHLDRGVMVLTRDRRLMMFDDTVRGALQLGEGLPHGKLLGSWSSDDRQTGFAVIHSESGPALYLLTIDLVHGNVQANQLHSKYLSRANPGSQPSGTTADGTIFFVIYPSMIEVFDIVTQQLLDSSYSELPERWKAGRYFWNPALGHSDAWSALVFDGSAIGFQRVPLGKYAHNNPPIALFDRRGHDGPFAVCPPGMIVNLCDQTTRVFMPKQSASLTVQDIDDDGKRVLIRFTESAASIPKTKIVDTATGLTTDLLNWESLDQMDASRVSTGLQPMRRLTRVFVGNEQLTLVSNGHVLWAFTIRSNRLLLEQSNQTNSDRLSRTFSSAKTPNAGYSLRVAEWNDGSRVWVDSRGLLHLQSSDPMIPEATFVLTSGVAVWTSDGRMLGSSYYVDDSFPTISPEEVIEDILIPFVSRLR